MLRVLFCETLDQTERVAMRFIMQNSFRQWRHDVDAFSASKLGPCRQPFFFKNFAHSQRCLQHRLPSHAFPRIEVDDKAVGVLEAFDRRVPGMQLYGADGDQLPKSTKVARRVLSARLGAFWETLKMRYAEQAHEDLAGGRTVSR